MERRRDAQIDPEHCAPGAVLDSERAWSNQGETRDGAAAGAFLCLVMDFELVGGACDTRWDQAERHARGQDSRIDGAHRDEA